MICSQCKRDLPETDFAPEKWSLLTKWVKRRQCLVRYRKKHPRGRRYDCNACRRERSAEHRERQRRWLETLAKHGNRP